MTATWQDKIWGTQANLKEPTFDEFLQLCREAKNLIEDLKRKHLELQGKKPSKLKAAAIHILAKEKGLNLTWNRLYIIYGITYPLIHRNTKLLKKILSKTEK